MGSFKIIPSHKLHKMSPSKYLMASKSSFGALNMNTTTQAWSTKMISLMDGEELSVQTILSSLMDNGKMEFYMDTIDGFIKMVTVIKENIKMAQLLEMFEIKNEYYL